MSMTNEVRTNGHAEHASVARLERRLAEIDASSEQRDAVLSAATADFVAAELSPRDEQIIDLKNEIVTLKERVADLEQKLEHGG